MRTIASGFALLLLVAPASAQNTDTRWSRWTGCWDLVTENAREGTPGPTASRRESRTPARDEARPQVCVVTSLNGGATFSTRVGTQTPIVQTVIPDGKDHPITEDGCTGTQRAEWSSDGLRLYARAEMTCKADQGLRRVSGLALLGADGRWTDVQSVDISGRESFRVRQYRRAPGNPTPTTAIGARALTLEDVAEASAKVSPRALEAALVETRASFDLTSKQLLDLDAAGVPASVVDLIVALSYPDRFVIERTASVDRAGSPISSTIRSGSAGGSAIRSGPTTTTRRTHYSPFAVSVLPLLLRRRLLRWRRLHRRRWRRWRQPSPATERPRTRCRRTRLHASDSPWGRAWPDRCVDCESRQRSLFHVVVRRLVPPPRHPAEVRAAAVSSQGFSSGGSSSGSSSGSSGGSSSGSSGGDSGEPRSQRNLR